MWKRGREERSLFCGWGPERRMHGFVKIDKWISLSCYMDLSTAECWKQAIWREEGEERSMFCGRGPERRIGGFFRATAFTAADRADATSSRGTDLTRMTRSALTGRKFWVDL